MSSLNGEKCQTHFIQNDDWDIWDKMLTEVNLNLQKKKLTF
jgi:hypothetical protein